MQISQDLQCGQGSPPAGLHSNPPFSPRYGDACAVVCAVLFGRQITREKGKRVKSRKRPQAPLANKGLLERGAERP